MFVLENVQFPAFGTSRSLHGRLDLLYQTGKSVAAVDVLAVFADAWTELMIGMVKFGFFVCLSGNGAARVLRNTSKDRRWSCTMMNEWQWLW